MTKFRIGRHISTSRGLLSAPVYGEKIGCQIIQIFLGSPTQAVSRPRTDAELVALGKELKSYKMKLVIHGLYTINLAHQPSSSRFRTSVRALEADLKACHIIGARCIGVIIHMGKNVSDEHISEKKAMFNYAHSLKVVIQQTNKAGIFTPIILETGAGVGSEVGSRMNELKFIYDQLNTEEKSRIKFCIDTCHIWAAGYDISTKESVKKFFSNFNKLFGVDRISCIHLNNSQAPLGSKVDRHADLQYGLINIAGIEAIVEIAYKHKIPIIMETPLDSFNRKTKADITFQDEFELVNGWVKKFRRQSNKTK